MNVSKEDELFVQKLRVSSNSFKKLKWYRYITYITRSQRESHIQAMKELTKWKSLWEEELASHGFKTDSNGVLVYNS